MIPNSTQVQTMLAPLIAAAAAWLASNFPLVDQATWNALVSGIAMAAAMAFIGFITKKASLANTLGKMPDTVVVTDPKTADSLPANDSVVSNTKVVVVPK